MRLIRSVLGGWGVGLGQQLTQMTVLHITVRSDQVSLVQASEVSGWFVLQGVTQHIQDTNFVTSLLLSNVMLSSHILK